MTLAILGATGAVGQEILHCMNDLQLPVEEIVLLASERSAGKEMETPLGTRVVQAVAPESFNGVDVAIFSAGGGSSKEWAPIANAAGCRVIDNSSAFRYDDAIPLVIPEINAQTIGDAMIIANPNCTTAIAAMALWPLHQAFGLKKVIMSTYQSTSGAGARGMQELLDETQHYFADEPVGNEIFSHPIPFNIIPRIDSMQDNGYTKEEMKVNWETRKIFGDDSLQISCTCVRIPVLRAHSEAIVIETEKVCDPAEARKVLSNAEGVDVVDDPENHVYPMPLTASGKYDIEVGRIRRNIVFGDHGLEFFLSGDQLLRGAAWNALKILEYILKG